MRVRGWVFDAGAGVFRLPDWESSGALALCSTRQGGVSRGPYTSLNLGLSVGDEPDRVQENRRRLAALAGIEASRLVFARQVHRTQVTRVGPQDAGRQGVGPAAPQADTDGLLTGTAAVAPVLLFADCVPVLLLAPRCRLVGVAHAGWRGAVAGVLVRLVEAARAAGAAVEELELTLGPSIGPECYPVGAEVVEAFHRAWPWSRRHIQPAGADLKGFLAEQAERAGLRPQAIVARAPCTACDPRLFSHRRDGPATGRMGVVVRWVTWSPREGDPGSTVEAVAEEIR